MQADLADELHLIRPPVATTERPRPPSSLNNSTIKARAATGADITQTAARNLLRGGQMNQNKRAASNQ